MSDHLHLLPSGCCALHECGSAAYDSAKYDGGGGRLLSILRLDLSKYSITSVHLLQFEVNDDDEISGCHSGPVFARPYVYLFLLHDDCFNDWNDD